MNWLGKVFVVVILIMSLVFMGLAMAVYATHKNWQQVSLDLNKKLTDAKSENAKLQTEHNRRVEDLEREKTVGRAASCEVGRRASFAGRAQHADSSRARRAQAESARPYRGRRIDAKDQ